MIMAYKILYIEDQSAESRERDLEDLGYIVETYDPSKDLGEILLKINSDTNALILDYRLTKGGNNVCFDAPTIAQTLRSKHSETNFEIPIILMSNEDIITEYYDKDLTSHDLFDFTLTKKEFNNNKEKFNQKLKSFINAYEIIKANNFKLANFETINFKIASVLGVKDDMGLIHSRIIQKLLSLKDDVFVSSNFIYSNIIRSIGLLIGEDILSSRLGVSKSSTDWAELKNRLASCTYTGIFSDIHSRWWMDKVNLWWIETVKCEIPLRRLSAEERVEVIKKNLMLPNLEVVQKTPQSKSSNFWTICKYSNMPLDPFDGIEILKDYLPWQEKEYLSIDSALEKMDNYKNMISAIDKKVIRELANKLNADG